MRTALFVLYMCRKRKGTWFATSAALASLSLLATAAASAARMLVPVDLRGRRPRGLFAARGRGARPLLSGGQGVGVRPHARCVEGHHVWPAREAGGEVLDRPVEVPAPLLRHSSHAVPARAPRVGRPPASPPAPALSRGWGRSAIPPPVLSGHAASLTPY